MKLKSYLLTGVQSAFLTFCLSVLGFNATASHIVGTDLYYKHINLDTYRVTVVLYGDCGRVPELLPGYLHHHHVYVSMMALCL